MIRILLKRIKTQRASNIWLILSCFVISLLLFSLVDQVLITYQTSKLPKGITFDKEHTYVVAVQASNNLLNQVKERGDDERVFRKKAMYDILEAIKADPAVEEAAFYMPLGYKQINLKEEHKKKYYPVTMVDTTFFRIVKPDILFGESNLTTSEFNEKWTIEGAYRPIIMDRAVINRIFYEDPELDNAYQNRSYAYIEKRNDNDYINCLGRDVLYNIGHFTPYKIISVMDTYTDDADAAGLCYMPLHERHIGNYGYMPKYMVKVKQGQKFNMNTFVTGHYYLQSVQLYIDEIKYAFDKYGYARIMNLVYLGVFFFFFNLLIGIMGSFWYRTNARTKDIGVQLSMGASPRSILWEFIGEAMLILLIALIPTILLTINQFYFEVVVNTTYTPITVGRYIECISITVALMILMMLLGVIYPTLRATRISPAAAVTAK
ncbi:MAG: FtsX-like permease family protein [Rikenellaceae bacterium]